MSIGQHHTLGVDTRVQGSVLYGSLGLGEGVGDAGIATLLGDVGAGCKGVACDTTVSYAVG